MQSTEFRQSIDAAEVREEWAPLLVQCGVLPDPLRSITLTVASPKNAPAIEVEVRDMESGAAIYRAGAASLKGQNPIAEGGGSLGVQVAVPTAMSAKCFGVFARSHGGSCRVQVLACFES